MARVPRKNLKNLRRIGPTLWTDGLRRYRFYDPEQDIVIVDGLPNRLTATNNDKKVVSVPNLNAWVGGTVNEVIVTPNLSGGIVLSLDTAITGRARRYFHSNY